jgi:hypothetical protein
LHDACQTPCEDCAENGSENTALSTKVLLS